jgi:hypothetical protein
MPNHTSIKDDKAKNQDSDSSVEYFTYGAAEQPQPEPVASQR